MAVGAVVVMLDLLVVEAVAVVHHLQSHRLEVEAEEVVPRDHRQEEVVVEVPRHCPRLCLLLLHLKCFLWRNLNRSITHNYEAKLIPINVLAFEANDSTPTAFDGPNSC